MQTWPHLFTIYSNPKWIQSALDDDVCVCVMSVMSALWYQAIQKVIRNNKCQTTVLVMLQMLYACHFHCRRQIREKWRAAFLPSLRPRQSCPCCVRCVTRDIQCRKGSTQNYREDINGFFFPFSSFSFVIIITCGVRRKGDGVRETSRNFTFQRSAWAKERMRCDDYDDSQRQRITNSHKHTHTWDVIH